MVHIYHWYQAVSDTLRRMNSARKTWEVFYANDGDVSPVEFQLDNSQRNSSDIGEKQIAPYIKDVVNFGISSRPEDEVFVYTNSDLSIVSDAARLIRDCVSKWGCGYSHRIDFEKDVFPDGIITRDQLREKVALGSWCGGSDIFFFNKDWWRKYADGLPDAIIGFEAWDSCFMAMMLKSGLTKPLSWITYHEQHTSYWKEHRTDAPGQIFNQKICSEWAQKNNLGHLINRGNFYFKVPTSYNVTI